MNVLLIYEDHYGFTGIAKDVNSAVSFLIKENRLSEDTDL